MAYDDFSLFLMLLKAWCCLRNSEVMLGKMRVCTLMYIKGEDSCSLYQESNAIWPPSSKGRIMHYQLGPYGVFGQS